MRIDTLGIGMLAATLVAAAVVANLPQRAPRTVVLGPRASQVTAHARPSTTAVAIPLPSPPTSMLTELARAETTGKIECSTDELDEEAAIEAALLTLIRARGRGTDARR